MTVFKFSFLHDHSKKYLEPPRPFFSMHCLRYMKVKRQLLFYHFQGTVLEFSRPVRTFESLERFFPDEHIS
jgi:hypothetical protein